MADIPNLLTSFRLDGDVAVVTGGGNGIGREIARAFASAGAHVVVADLEEEAALSVADEIADAGLRAEALVLNVTQEHAVGRAFAEVIKEHGRLDVLVNNAGVTIRAPAVELSLEDWKTVNDVNVTGVFICARTAARHMMAADGRGGQPNPDACGGMGQIACARQRCGADLGADAVHPAAAG